MADQNTAARKSAARRSCSSRERTPSILSAENQPGHVKNKTSDRPSIVTYATIRNGQDQVHRHYMPKWVNSSKMVQLPVYYTCTMLTVPSFPLSC